VITATACTDYWRQSALIRTFQLIFVLIEGGILVLPNLYKLTLVAPPSMRDDLHRYLLPLLLLLFQILNVCLNRVFEEFILFIFSQLIESL
jgi:hypothetical protein